MYFIGLSEHDKQTLLSGLLFIRKGENPYRTQFSTDDADKGAEWMQIWANSAMRNGQSMIGLPMALYDENIKEKMPKDPSKPWVIFIKDNVDGVLVSKETFENCLDGMPVWKDMDNIEPGKVGSFFEQDESKRTKKLYEMWGKYIQKKKDLTVKLTWFLTYENVEKIIHD